MAISNDRCQGGDICFLESGIRLRLLCGDMVVFSSARIRHYNMPFQGEHASLVVHSDSFGDNWVKNRNNSDHNVHMNVERYS